MKKVDLPGGVAAFLLDRREVPHGRRRALVAALDARNAARDTGDNSLAVNLAIGETAVRVGVGRWTVCAPGSNDVLPIPWDDPSALDQAPGDVVDALLQHVTSMIDEYLPNGKPDPKSAKPSSSADTPASTSAP